MDTNANRGGSVRAVGMLLAVLLLLAVTLAMAGKAEAHQTAGRTVISVDGEVVKNTRDDHFAFRRNLSPGCHQVKVVQRRGGNVYAVYQQRECSRGQSVLTVKVDHSNVSISTYSKSVVYADPMAR